jgi:hypothetical protein
MKIINNIGCALNSIQQLDSIEWNSNWIKKNGMKIDGEDIESLLANMMLEKNF